MSRPRPDTDLLKDKTYNHLTLRTVELKKSHRFWKCECVCGKFVVRREDALLRGAAKSCGCQHPRRKKGAEHPTWKGCGDLNGQYYGYLKMSAGKREHEFDVSIERLWEIFLEQNRRCALTGLPLCFKGHKDKLAGANQTASLDRIDSKKGYVEGNVWWVHKDINEMKMAFSQKRFVELCRLVTEHVAAIKASKRASSERKRRRHEQTESSGPIEFHGCSHSTVPQTPQPWLWSASSLGEPNLLPVVAPVAGGLDQVGVHERPGAGRAGLGEGKGVVGEEPVLVEPHQPLLFLGGEDVVEPLGVEPLLGEDVEQDRLTDHAPAPELEPVPLGVGDGLDEHRRKLNPALGQDVPGPAPLLEELTIVNSERIRLDLAPPRVVGRAHLEQAVAELALDGGGG